MSFDPHARLLLTRITWRWLPDNLLERLVGFKFGEIAVSFALVGGHDIVQLAPPELGDVLRAGDPAVDDDGRAFGKPHPFFEQVEHRAEALPILEIALEDLVRAGKAFSTNDQPHDDLFAVWTMVA